MQNLLDVSMCVHVCADGDTQDNDGRADEPTNNLN